MGIRGARKTWTTCAPTASERVTVKSFFEGGEYLYRLVKRLSGGKYSGPVKLILDCCASRHAVVLWPSGTVGLGKT
jgi:hypothetical protein